jgi:hypothetical protein
MARFESLLTAGGIAYGVTYYRDRYASDAAQSARIVIDIQIGGYQVSTIVDTGAPWCVLDPEIARPLIADSRAEFLHPLRYLIRGHFYDGALFRVELAIEDEQGNDLSVDATVFVPTLELDEEWHHPNFIGLDRCLNRIWFTVDPVESVFYFGLA